MAVPVRDLSRRRFMSDVGFGQCVGWAALSMMKVDLLDWPNIRLRIDCTFQYVRWTCVLILET